MIPVPEPHIQRLDHALDLSRQVRPHLALHVQALVPGDQFVETGIEQAELVLDFVLVLAAEGLDHGRAVDGGALARTQRSGTAGRLDLVEEVVCRVAPGGQVQGRAGFPVRLEFRVVGRDAEVAGEVRRGLNCAGKDGDAVQLEDPLEGFLGVLGLRAGV